MTNNCIDHDDNQVRVTKRADGREENMRDLGRGDYFGEQVFYVTFLWEIYYLKDKMAVVDMTKKNFDI